MTNTQLFCHTLSCEMCHGTYRMFPDIIYLTYLLPINTRHTNTPCWEDKCRICLQYIVYKRQRETLFLEVVYIKAKLMNIPLNNLYQFNYGIYPIWRLWIFFQFFLRAEHWLERVDFSVKFIYGVDDIWDTLFQLMQKQSFIRKICSLGI